MPHATHRRARAASSRPTARRPLVERMEERTLLTVGALPTASEQVVTQFYQDLLRRLPDDGGLAHWAGQLDDGAAPPAVAAALAHSPEFHAGQLDGVYQRLLGRNADAGGRAFFASALGAGQPLALVEADIAASAEFRQLHGAHASGFLGALLDGGGDAVSGLYHQILRRDADPSGRAYWAGQLASGMSLGDVAASLATSAEKAAMSAPTSTLLRTLGDDSALPTAAVGDLETELAGAARAALGLRASPGPQAVTLKNGLPGVFQAFGPQRLVDTRNPVAGQYGGPTPGAGTTRTINVSPYDLADPSVPSADIGDTPPTSNLPTGITAISVILFVVGAPAPEYLTAYATGTSPAPINTATVFADRAGQIIAASAIVPVSAAGDIDIYTSGGGDYIVDVTGYFLNTLDGADYLPITGNVPDAGVVVGTNVSTTSEAAGVTGVISATSAGFSSAGVRGINNGTAGLGIGVYGSQDGFGVGVRGVVAGAGAGGYFTSGAGGSAVRGIVDGAGGVGGNFTAGSGGVGVIGGAFGPDSVGVRGYVFDTGSIGGDFLGATGVRATTSDAGVVNGVLGQVTSASAAGGSAGVRGTNASTVAAANGVLGEITSSTPGANSAGVRGLLTSLGNVGIGVYGSHAGAGIGVFGLASTNGVGVLGSAPTAGSGVAVRANGNFVATGTKAFVEPSPLDASKQIAFIALEGNEVGTYFGGRGHFTNGTATISVPESFRLVTEADGLRVLLEPIGALAITAVQSADLNHVVVLGSQDVEFYYQVNGIRKGYQGHDPVQTNTVFVPQSATDTLPNWLTGTQKQTLIANGTYHADGTVNLTTAHALGWDATWTTTTAA